MQRRFCTTRPTAGVHPADEEQAYNRLLERYMALIEGAQKDCVGCWHRGRWRCPETETQKWVVWRKKGSSSQLSSAVLTVFVTATRLPATTPRLATGLHEPLNDRTRREPAPTTPANEHMMELEIPGLKSVAFGGDFSATQPILTADAGRC